MGIKGIYGEIGAGQRIALAKLAVDAFELRDRPLRLAIDISIWLFQIQSGKGGTNPALRTFYYRLLRLISLGIHPLFVFDGPEKPPFKRNKRSGPNVASVPEFLAKQLLKQFGFPFHLARGEAEAECALLQRKGVVDAVLSEDVDTLMFGSGLTLRNWSPLATTKTKVPTHVNLYDAQKTKAGPSGLDRNGMILIALMSGGDYIPEGIPGCGVKTACEAARAGFGDSLCKIDRHDRTALLAWKSELVHELRTNEGRFFKQKHKTLVIPDEFPRSDVLGYYTHPVVSSDSNIERLRNNLKWDQEIDIPALRSFCADAFDWVCISGAKHFARKLAPSLLVKELRLRSQRTPPDDLCLAGKEEQALVKSIYSKRESPTTDNISELRISFVPLDLVEIDLDAEDPDPETRQQALDSDDEGPTVEADDGPTVTESPRKARGPMKYDPSTMQKAWIPETFIRVGVPLKMQDWEESYQDAHKYEAMKAVRRVTEKATRKKKAAGAMPKGALYRFTQSSKPVAGAAMAENADSHSGHDKTSTSKPRIESVDLSELSMAGSISVTVAESSVRQTDTRRQRAKGSSQAGIKPSKASEHIVAPPSSQSNRSAIQSTFRVPAALQSSPATPRKNAQLSIVNLLSSPPQPLEKALSEVNEEHSPRVALAVPKEAPIFYNDVSAAIADEVDGMELPQLPPSVSTRKRRSPLRRAETLPNPRIEDDLGNSPPRKRMNLISNDDSRLPDRPATPEMRSNIVSLLSSSPIGPDQNALALNSNTGPDLEQLPATPSPIRHRKQDMDVSKQLNANNDEKPGVLQATTSKKQYIRLRESLNGAFALDGNAVSPTEASVRANEKPSKQGRRGKTWRVSAVQHMDLTTT